MRFRYISSIRGRPGKHGKYDDIPAPIPFFITAKIRLKCPVIARVDQHLWTIEFSLTMIR